MKTTSKHRESYLKCKGFTKGVLYQAEVDCIVLCTKTDLNNLYGVVVSGTSFSLGDDNNGISWNTSVFTPFYGEVTIEQTV